MARLNAREVSWEKVEVFGKEGLFVDLRIDRNTVPEGYIMYEIRHSDEDWGEPAQIGEWILVNFYGTILMKESLDLIRSSAINNSYLDIEDPEDFWFFDERIELS